MPKYRVEAKAFAWVIVWEGEAKNKNDAEEKAEQEGDWYPQLCWECSNTVSLTEIDISCASDIEINEIYD
jgi:hypothetical protein